MIWNDMYHVNADDWNDLWMEGVWKTHVSHQYRYSKLCCYDHMDAISKLLTISLFLHIHGVLHNFGIIKES